MRRSPACRLVSLNVPEASTATYASSPLPTAVMAGKAAQTSSEMPAKMSFLRPVASMARVTRASSNALTDERSMISMPGRASTSSGNVGPHMLSRAVVAATIGEHNRRVLRSQRFVGTRLIIHCILLRIDPGIGQLPGPEDHLVYVTFRFILKLDCIR